MNINIENLNAAQRAVLVRLSECPGYTKQEVLNRLPDFSAHLQPANAELSEACNEFIVAMQPLVGNLES